METITCDPAEFITNRIELGLDEIGLAIRGEPDWGDSEMELFLVRQALGEIPADRRPPNRQAAIDLMVREEGAVSLAVAAAKIQQKVGVWQREGGFVKRVLDPAGGFTTDVATQVHGAAIGGIQGWLMAHRQNAPDVHLSLTTDPYFYDTTEIESGLFKAENVAHLEWEIEKVKGSAPGLFRCQVKNEGAFDWKGLLAAMESRDLAGAGTRNTTADIAYECEALTMAGGSASAANAEASSGNVAKNTALSSGFINVLSSKIVASGHMTHTGPRRVWFRAKDTSATENVELMLVWRALGSPKWSENKVVKMPVQAAFAKVDLGEVLPEAAVLGEQRWEFKVMARARQGAGTIELDVTYILPTEQMLAVTTPPVTLQPDGQSAKSPTVGESLAGPGVAWTTPGNIASSNNVYATAEPPIGGAETDELLAKTFGFAIPAEATITGVVVEIERKTNVAETFMEDSFVRIGTASAGASLNYAKKGTFWPTVEAYAVYGSSTDTWGLDLTPALVNGAGFCVGLIMRNYGPTSGTLVSVDHIKVTVYYSTTPDENFVCSATRSMEMRSDGVFRQHRTDDVWGRGVPDGFLPFAPPSGMESRAVRGVIVPSRGDHLAQADAGNHKISARVFYFPGALFVSEI